MTLEDANKVLDAALGGGFFERFATEVWSSHGRAVLRQAVRELVGPEATGHGWYIRIRIRAINGLPDADILPPNVDHDFMKSGEVKIEAVWLSPYPPGSEDSRLG
jgi:hypothetical protein